MEALQLAAQPLPTTLDGLLSLLRLGAEKLGIDDYVIAEMLSNPDFDAGKFVDDLEEKILDATRDKVDGYQVVIDEFEMFAGRMRERAANFQKKAEDMAKLARSGEASAERVRERIGFQMEFRKIEQLAGFKYTFFRKQHHTPSCKPKVPVPGAAEMVVYGSAYVKEVPVSYQWVLNPIKDDMLAGKFVTDKFELVYSHKIVCKMTDQPKVADKKKAAKS